MHKDVIISSSPFLVRFRPEKFFSKRDSSSRANRLLLQGSRSHDLGNISLTFHVVYFKISLQLESLFRYFKFTPVTDLQSFFTMLKRILISLLGDLLAFLQNVWNLAKTWFLMLSWPSHRKFSTMFVWVLRETFHINLD